MKQYNPIKKVTADMTLIQLKWAAWFVSIVFLVYLALRIVSGRVEINGEILSEQTFLSFVYGPSKIYMLVIGILSVSSFLAFFVKHGVTRKDYFVGGAVAAFIISFVLMATGTIVAALEHFFIPTSDISGFLRMESSWLFATIGFSLNVLLYFMAGWLIGAGFYRFGGWGGMLYILLALIFVGISDTLWEYDIENPLNNLLNNINMAEISFLGAFIGSIVLLAIELFLVRNTTKSVRIKRK